MTRAPASAYKLALTMYENQSDPNSSVDLFTSGKVN